jgi:hypothetical protein
MAQRPSGHSESHLSIAVLYDPLVVTQFIEIMELLRVQGPKNNILAVGDYLHADGPFEEKNNNFDSALSSIEKCIE